MTEAQSTRPVPAGGHGDSRRGERRAPSPVLGISSLVLAICLTLFVIDGWRSWRLYGKVIDEAQVKLNNLNRLIAEQTRSALDIADTLLLTAARSAESARREPLAKQRIHDFLLTATQKEPWLNAVYVYDEAGNFLMGSGEPPPLLGQQEAFTFHRQHIEDSFHMGAVARDAASGRWRMTFSRRWSKADGSFGGVVLGDGDLAYFQHLFGTLDMGRDGTINLFGDDGRLLVRQPYAEASIGKPVAYDSPIGPYLHRGPGGSFRAVSSVDGHERIFYYRHLDAYPVVVTTALATEDVLADWRKDTLQHLAVVALLSILFAVLGYRLSRQLLRRMTIERGMAEQHAFHLSVQDSLSARLAVLDAHGNLLGVNRAWQSFVCRLQPGATRAAAVGENYLETYIEAEGFEGEEVTTHVRSGITDVLSGVRAEYEVEYCTNDAEPRTCFLMHVTPLLGARRGAVIVHENISNLKQVEHQLREEKRFLRLLISAIPGMVAYWTRDLHCRFSNDAYLTWFGKSSEEMLGISMRDLLGETLFQQNEPYIQGVLQGEAQRFERALTKANGEKGYTWAHYLPDVEGGQVRGFFVLVSDVTELKQGQIKLEQLNEALSLRTRQAEAANLAKSQFLANMSHEIRTPLHTILGFTRLLRKQLGQEQESKIQIIENSGAHLLQLIEGILTFSSGESREPAIFPEAVALQTLIIKLQSIGEIAAMARRNVFLIDAAPDLPAMLALDEQHLTQVLQNLVANACKFTEHGVVKLRISRESSDPGEETWHNVRFAVEDTGIGIAAEHHQHIFEAFGRVVTGQRLGGVGLGLAIAQQLVKAMGGLIEVDSEPGIGSRFHFTLRLREVPVYEGIVQAPARDNIIGHSPPRRSILVADDIEGNRQFLNLLLTMWGFRVLEAADGTEALALCVEAGQEIDVVLTDQYMPHMGGWEFLRALRKQETQNGGERRMPVVLLSAALPDRPLDFPEDLEFDEVLMKPLDESKLANWLEKVLDLQWQRAARPVDASAVAAPLVFPPLDEHARIQQMLKLGQIIAIRRWAEALQGEQAIYGGFCARVIQLCAEINLEQLKLLLADWAS